MKQWLYKFLSELNVVLTWLGFYVFDFIAHCWATFSALRALLSSHIITNKSGVEEGNQWQGKSLPAPYKFHPAQRVANNSPSSGPFFCFSVWFCDGTAKSKLLLSFKLIASAIAEIFKGTPKFGAPLAMPTFCISAWFCGGSYQKQGAYQFWSHSRTINNYYNRVTRLPRNGDFRNSSR